LSKRATSKHVPIEALAGEGLSWNRPAQAVLFGRVGMVTEYAPSRSRCHAAVIFVDDDLGKWLIVLKVANLPVAPVAPVAPVVQRLIHP
jgi:hypothetical protein